MGGGWRVDTEGLGNEWEQSTRGEVPKESIKSMFKKM